MPKSKPQKPEDLLAIVPVARAPHTGPRDIGPVAAALADVLGDTYCLTFKTHAYHWNIEGPLFYPVHILTEGQYENLFAAADTLAERLRALGRLAPMHLGKMIANSVIKDLESVPSGRAMNEDLERDHARLATRMHRLFVLAEAAHDPVTADLATQRSAFHEKAAWMLHATAAV